MAKDFGIENPPSANSKNGRMPRGVQDR